MSAIYIHIPFCKKACTYCNFHFSTNLDQKGAMVAAIVKEITDWKLTAIEAVSAEDLPAAGKPVVHTVYFGGGTPSLLSGAELQSIMAALQAQFEISPTAEITLETNPDDHSSEKLYIWKNAGVNRLSIGVQSFFEDDLVWMNRAHNAAQSVSCISAARRAGFEHLTIDLIYGIPGLSNERWKSNFEAAIAAGINHLSCYALTVEPKTALEQLISRGRKQPVEAEQQAAQFLLLMDWAAAAGFEHYEISNFARPGHQSRHNSSYWQGLPYLGFGPAAHSFDGKARRWWNISNNNIYIKAMENGLQHSEAETLTPNQQLNEYLMTSLRTIEGVQLGDHRMKERFNKHFKQTLDKWQSTGHLQADAHRIWLTNKGKLFADGIAADFFV